MKYSLAIINDNILRKKVIFSYTSVTLIHHHVTKNCICYNHFQLSKYGKQYSDILALHLGIQLSNICPDLK